jgi:hypothetical protein
MLLYRLEIRECALPCRLPSFFIALAYIRVDLSFLASASFLTPLLLFTTVSEARAATISSLGWPSCAVATEGGSCRGGGATVRRSA